jgi:hypothetical protein
MHLLTKEILYSEMYLESSFDKCFYSLSRVVVMQVGRDDTSLHGYQNLDDGAYPRCWFRVPNIGFD